MGLDICALVASDVALSSSRTMRPADVLATVVLAAAAGAVMLTMVTGPGGPEGGRCAPSLVR